MTVKTLMPVRNLNLVAPLAHKATDMHITDTTASQRDRSGAAPHLIVRALGQTFDFWPGTGLWQQRGTTQQHRGVHKLIERCKPAGDAS